MGHYSSLGIKARNQVHAVSEDRSPVRLRLYGRKMLRLAVAWSFLLAMMLPPAGHSAAHFVGAVDACATSSHVDAAAGHGDRGHSHDREQSCDPNAGHLHDHNPADHTHDVPAAALGQALPPVRIGGLPAALPPDRFFRTPSFRIDRPPRSGALT